MSKTYKKVEVKTLSLKELMIIFQFEGSRLFFYFFYFVL